MKKLSGYAVVLMVALFLGACTSGGEPAKVSETQAPVAASPPADCGGEPTKAEIEEAATQPGGGKRVELTIEQMSELLSHMPQVEQYVVEHSIDELELYRSETNPDIYLLFGFSKGCLAGRAQIGARSVAKWLGEDA